VVAIITTKIKLMEELMDMRDYSRIARLCKIYRDMDTEGREEIVAAAAKLFYVQETSENRYASLKVSYGIAKNYPKYRAYRINGIPGFLALGLLLVFTAYAFWVTVIGPALFIPSITLLVMVRIIVTALCGMFIICTGLVWFIIRKITIPWMLLAIGAGVLCVDPGTLTDLIGFAIIAVIVAVQVIQRKRDNTAMNV